MQRPYIIAFSTVSLDGRIAASTGYSQLSCTYDKTRLYLLRGWCDAVLVGANTVKIDNPRLVKRYKPKSSRFYRIVVDGRLTLTPDYRIFRDKTYPTILITCKGNRAEEFRNINVIVFEGECSNGVLDLREAVSKLLREFNISTILVEGGGITLYNLLRQGLLDEIRVTVTPKIFAAGRSVLEDPLGKGFTRAFSRLKLVYHELCPCGDCIHIVYKVVATWGNPVRARIPYSFKQLKELNPNMQDV